MKTLRLIPLLLVLALPAASAFAAAAVLPSSDAKKLADRYNLTKTRIQSLLGARMHPEAFPATVLPNPFYRSIAPAQTDSTQLFSPTSRGGTELAPQPDAPDLSDADTLAKYATALKLSGYIVLGGVPHFTVNGTVCKVGDVVTVGTKDRPVFLHIISLTPQEATLRYNEATYVLPLRK